ncbi:MAG: adenine phosphoribosyltransferase [Candidatus Ratteibacteria bacterium]|nr:adenine phosphoribosyltransferase [Candidatus Ratteibacteria bacterium]
MKDIETLKSAIRDVPDFPRKGIIFKDITPVLKDGKLFSLAIENMLEPFRDQKIDSVVAIEARGFIFGGAMANILNCGIIPIRKSGKLPSKTHSIDYELEYGTDTLEVHTDAINKGDKILLVDDLLATGGTARGVCKLIEKSGGEIVGISFLIELAFLNGREKLKNYPVHSVLQF